jgi:hypothetical protein
VLGSTTLILNSRALVRNDFTITFDQKLAVVSPEPHRATSPCSARRYADGAGSIERRSTPKIRPEIQPATMGVMVVVYAGFDGRVLAGIPLGE